VQGSDREDEGRVDVCEEHLRAQRGVDQRRDAAVSSLEVRPQSPNTRWGVEFGVWVWGLGFGVWGLGFGVWGFGFGFWDLGVEVWGLEVGVEGFKGLGLRLGSSK